MLLKHAYSLIGSLMSKFTNNNKNRKRNYFLKHTKMVSILKVR